MTTCLSKAQAHSSIHRPVIVLPLECSGMALLFTHLLQQAHAQASGTACAAFCACPTPTLFGPTSCPLPACPHTLPPNPLHLHLHVLLHPAGWHQLKHGSRAARGTKEEKRSLGDVIRMHCQVRGGGCHLHAPPGLDKEDAMCVHCQVERIEGMPSVCTARLRGSSRRLSWGTGWGLMDATAACGDVTRMHCQVPSPQGQGSTPQGLMAANSAGGPAGAVGGGGSCLRSVRQGLSRLPALPRQPTAGARGVAV